MTIRFPFDSSRQSAICAAALFLLSGCLAEEKEADVQSADAANIDLSGSVGDGPVVGADMLVSSVDETTIATFQSDTHARFNISLKVDEALYPLTIVARNGTDLVTGTSPGFEMWGYVRDSGDSVIANVNPFSTIAAELALLLPGGRTSQSLIDAEAIVSRVINSGLIGLDETGPGSTRIDESNVAEIVKASETLSEIVRRTRDLLQGTGLGWGADDVILSIAADLTDEVVDGRGVSTTNPRTAAVWTIVSAQVLLESMANELHVNGAEATESIRSAIDQVTDGTPTTSIDQLGASGEMIRCARIALAAAFAIDRDPAIRGLHTVISGLSAGQSPTLIRIALPSNYRNLLQSALMSIANADDATIELVNSIARSNGDIDEENHPPVIQGAPITNVTAGSNYLFVPSASDSDGDPLVFEIANRPTWVTFDASTGTMSGLPQSSDIGDYTDITVSVFDGEFRDTLIPFSISVSQSNSPPRISGAAPDSVTVGEEYSFTPTANDSENDTLVFSIARRPAWAGFDTSTGQISGAPSGNDVGSYNNIVISVSDGQFAASLPGFSITVMPSAGNSPPRISGSAPTSVNENENYSFIPTAVDPDGDSLTFAIVALPSWANFDPTNGRIWGVPDSGDVGTYSGISISVSDGMETDQLPTFSIVVQAVSLGSVSLSWTAPTEYEDGSPLTDLAGYRIYWRTSSGTYSNSATVNNSSVTSYVVENLSPGTYEFVATSFNSAGVESGYSISTTTVVE